MEFWVEGQALRAQDERVIPAVPVKAHNNTFDAASTFWIRAF